jgi:hypothetical protein
MTLDEKELMVIDQSDPSNIIGFDIFTHPHDTLSQRTTRINEIHTRTALVAASNPMGTNRKPLFFFLKSVHRDIFVVDAYDAACQAIRDACQTCNRNCRDLTHFLSQSRLVPQIKKYKRISRDDRDRMQAALDAPGIAIDTKEYVQQGLITTGNVDAIVGRRSIGKKTVWLSEKPAVAIVNMRRWTGSGYDICCMPAVRKVGFQSHSLDKLSTTSLIAHLLYTNFTETATRIARKLMPSVLPRELIHTHETSREKTTLIAEFQRQVKLGLCLYAIGDTSVLSNSEHEEANDVLYAIMHGGVRDPTVANPYELSIRLLTPLAAVAGECTPFRGWTTALPTHGIGYGIFNSFKGYERAPGFNTRDKSTLRKLLLSQMVTHLHSTGVTFTSRPDEIQTQVYYSLPPSPFTPLRTYWETYTEDIDYMPFETLAIGGSRYNIPRVERFDSEPTEELLYDVKSM